MVINLLKFVVLLIITLADTANKPVLSWQQLQTEPTGHKISVQLESIHIISLNVTSRHHILQKQVL